MPFVQRRGRCQLTGFLAGADDRGCVGGDILGGLEGEILGFMAGLIFGGRLEYALQKLGGFFHKSVPNLKCS